MIVELQSRLSGNQNLLFMDSIHLSVKQGKYA
jgi:hypothetical protein